MWRHYEHHKEPLLPRLLFYRRLAKHIFLSLGLLLCALLIGAQGYRLTEDMDWVEALLNATHVLSGMGPFHKPENNTAKLFASFYALFSGIAFITTAGIVITPIAHRILHRLHLDDD